MQEVSFWSFQITLGIFHQDLTHGTPPPQLVDPCNLRAIMFIRDHSAAEVAMFRVKQLKRFSQRAVELAAQEAELRASLNEDVRTVLAGKCLLLFKEMASEAQVGDDGLFDELVKRRNA